MRKSFSLIEWCKVGNNLLDTCRWIGCCQCDDVVVDIVVGSHSLRPAVELPATPQSFDPLEMKTIRSLQRSIFAGSMASPASSTSSSSSAFVLLQCWFLFRWFVLYLFIYRTSFCFNGHLLWGYDTFFISTDERNDLIQFFDHLSDSFELFFF